MAADTLGLPEDNLMSLFHDSLPCVDSKLLAAQLDWRLLQKLVQPVQLFILMPVPACWT